MMRRPKWFLISLPIVAALAPNYNCVFRKQEVQNGIYIKNNRFVYNNKKRKIDKGPAQKTTALRYFSLLNFQMKKSTDERKEEWTFFSFRSGAGSPKTLIRSLRGEGGGGGWWSESVLV